jgi:hypothetical protein
MGNVDSMTPTDAQITVPEAARRMGLAGDEVYRLIFRGELRGAPREDGAVYVSIASVEQYLSGHPRAQAEQS